MKQTVSPLAQYQAALAQGFEEDKSQVAAVEALHTCYRALHQGDTPQGVYLWGPVGRGKTWLMDAFHSSLRVPSRRQHFHHFMAWLHQRLFQLTGVVNPLQRVAEELAQALKVLCFDEFFVTDIGDALLLGPLFQALFERDIVVVATSNQAPEQLYEGGFNRERFLPAIAAIQAHMQVIHLDGKKDYRQRRQGAPKRYWLQGEKDFAQLFHDISGEAPQATQLSLHGRKLAVLGAANQVLWGTFAQLCEGYLSAQDYMALCAEYAHVLVSHVPQLSAPTRAQYIARGTEDAAERVAAGDRHLVALSPKDNSVRRFIALVDECYESNVALYVQAEVPLNALYEEGALLFPFRRTQSRLAEF